MNHTPMPMFTYQWNVGPSWNGDLITIANWLGHVSVNTTNKYVTLNMEMKRKVLSKSKPLIDTTEQQKSLELTTDIIDWLESL